MEKKIMNKLKEKGLADSSIQLYIRQLQKLNEDQPLKSLSFLSNTDDIMERLSKYKENTTKLYLSAIVAILDIITKKKPVYLDFYKNKLNELKQTYNNRDKNEKSDKEQNNWLDYKEVKTTLDNLLENINTYKNKRKLTIKEYDVLLKTFILSLYTLIPPRRNKDYLDMIIVKNDADIISTDVNYLILKQNKFIFNQFKTKKTGQQEISFADNKDFINILTIYLKHHPLLHSLKQRPFASNQEINLLVNYEGKPLTHINSITRILNKVFGKKIGSSMLRKIYLSYKFGDQLDAIREMKDTATAMGHSSATAQNVYIKE